MSMNPTTRNGTYVLAVVEKIVLAEVAAALIAVVEISVVSFLFLSPARLTTASSTVPALSCASRINRAACPDFVPSVAVDGTVTEIGAETERVLTVPLLSAEERKSSVVGLSVKVSALVATDAVTG